MDRTALFHRVVESIGEYLERDVSFLTPESRPATEIPGLDSLRMFEMFLFLEDRFGVKFGDEVVDHLGTIGQLVDFIGSHGVEGASTA